RRTGVTTNPLDSAENPHCSVPLLQWRGKLSMPNDLSHPVAGARRKRRRCLERDLAMLAVPDPRPPADAVRALARRGVLATTVAGATPAERARLTGGAYDIAWPVVFTGLTQGLERRRGHLTCATSVCHLADECLDRFEDDVEAVVHDVVHSARKPI